jgi:hypothetical protein
MFQIEDNLPNHLILLVSHILAPRHESRVRNNRTPKPVFKL